MVDRVKPANIYGSYLQGVSAGNEMDELAKQRKRQILQDQVAQKMRDPNFNYMEDPDYAEFMATSPDEAERITGNFLKLDKSRKAAAYEDAYKVSRLIDSGQFGQAIEHLEDRTDAIEKLGGDASHTSAALQMAAAGDWDKLKQYAGSIVNEGVRFGYIEPEKLMNNRRFAYEGEDVLLQELQRARAEENAKENPDPEVLEGLAERIRNITSPTEAQRVETKRSEATIKEGLEKNIDINKRLTGYVNSGVDAADGVANLERTKKLLTLVETGGIDKASFLAKRFFGIEGASEGELSNRLGVAVLAQLKPIFGAAFTNEEGKRLDKIMANFGNNPETNKRLIAEALTISKRAANRAIRAAERLGDDFAADEIRLALEFDSDEFLSQIDDQSAGSRAKPPAANQPTTLDALEARLRGGQ